MMLLVHILTTILFAYIFVSVAYLLFFAVAGRFGKLKKYTVHQQKAKFAVIIPSYKEDNIIIDTASQALKQHYPPDKFSVTVIADCLKPETVQQLRNLPIEVVEVNFEKSMKAKSLHAAFEQLPSNHYDLALILDADNIMSSDCLEKINHAYQDGWKVIQCHRTAKNKNTDVAVLDALSEEVNNTIFRRGHRVRGFSCTLIGSGMAFEFDLLKEIFNLPTIHNNPGEDREVDMQLVKRDINVEYIDDAYILDEKVQRREVFEKQRTRWLGTHIEHLSRFFQKDLHSKFSKKLFLNKLFQNLLLPRLLFMLLFFFLIIIAVIDMITASGILMPMPVYWLLCFVLYLVTIAIAVPRSFYNKDTINALMHIPGLAFSMLKALFRFKQNKKGFLHTPKEFSQ